jgi:hypothetical protein
LQEKLQTALTLTLSRRERGFFQQPALARRASEGRTTIDCSLEIGQMDNLGRRSPSLARRASVFLLEEK